MLIVIRQRDKAVPMMKTCLVNAPGRPLPGPFKATPNTLPTRERKTGDDVEPGQLLKDDLTVRTLVGRKGVKAGHITDECHRAWELERYSCV